MGTGIGTGIVSGGRLVRGHHDGAGDVGYVVPVGAHIVPATGAYGALETLASGPVLVQHAHAMVQRVRRPSLLKTSSLRVQATVLGAIAAGLDLIHQGHGSAVALQIKAPGQGHAEATG